MGPPAALDDAAAAQHQDRPAGRTRSSSCSSTIGMGLHALQDFYSHSNWMEQQGVTGVDGTDWSKLTFGLTPTWFDVPKADARQAQRLHRRVDRAQGAPARRLEHRRQQVDGEGRQQGLAGAPGYTDAYTTVVLRHAPVGARDARGARRRGAVERALRYANRRGGRARPRPQGRAADRDDDRPLAGSGRAVRPVVLAERLRVAQRPRRRPHRRAQRRSATTSRTAAGRRSAARSRRSSRCSPRSSRTATCCPSRRAATCRRRRASSSMRVTSMKGVGLRGARRPDARRPRRHVHPRDDRRPELPVRRDQRSRQLRLPAAVRAVHVHQGDPRRRVATPSR